MMEAATPWAGTSSVEADDAISLHHRLGNYHHTWAAIGLRWIPPQLAKDFGPATWVAVDALALELTRSRQPPERIDPDLITRAATLVGPAWPVVNKPGVHRSRIALDVPVIWGVGEVCNIMIREQMMGSDPKDHARLQRALDAGRVLGASLQNTIGERYFQSGSPPPARHLSAQWRAFETALADALGALFLIPILLWPHDQTSTPGTPDLSLFESDV